MNRENQSSTNQVPSIFKHRNPTNTSMVQVGGTPSSSINKRSSPSVIRRRTSPQKVPSKIKEDSDMKEEKSNKGRKLIKEETQQDDIEKKLKTQRKSPRRGSPGKMLIKPTQTDDYDDEDDETESEEENINGNNKKEKKTRKSPRKTKRKINKWAEMIGYITNSVASEVGYPIRAEEFMTIIRKNYPGNPPAKKKISKDTYKERAKAKFQILKEVDESLIDKANKSINEIIQLIKKEGRDM